LKVMRVTPINMAEAIIEPFWDPGLSGLDGWSIKDGSGHGLKVGQTWCNVSVNWEKRPQGGPVLRMERSTELDVSGYDGLVVSAALPEDGRLRIEAMTDRGTVGKTFGQGGKVEDVLPLEGATTLLWFAVEIHVGRPQASSAWFNWIGLQHAGLLERYNKQWSRFDARWEGYLVDESSEPSFLPAYGIAITPEELERNRERHEAEWAETGTSGYWEQAKPFMDVAPESQIREYARFWQDSRFARTRENDQFIVSPGMKLLLYALLTRDKKLLRLAARYALSLCMIPNWSDGFITRFPGGIFDHRCFVQSLVLTELAFALDGAGDLFTPLGKELIMRRMMEEGLGGVNWTVWKHDYIFECNQLAWFTAGRMLGYAVLSREYPRIIPYMEQAYREICESMESVVAGDGSTVEGPMYFMCQPGMGGAGLYYYARVTGRPFAEVVPGSLLRTAEYVDSIVSTDRGRDFITICDSGPNASLRSAAVMAHLMPDSQWVTVARKALKRAGGRCNDFIAEDLLRSLPDADPPPKPFVSLPEAGYAASTRMLHGRPAKLFVMGNKAGAGHTHEDKGSFVLEYAGDTFAMDPGVCSYNLPMSRELQQCQWHNMLLPLGTPERPHPSHPLEVDVRPEGDGDETRVRLRTELAASFPDYYGRWERSYGSEKTEELIVTDEYELLRGMGVAFHVHTLLPCALHQGKVVLTGREALCEIGVPDGCEADIEELQHPDLGVIRRIRILREGTAGRLAVSFRLAVLQAGE
jgi:hypothetical protein